MILKEDHCILEGREKAVRLLTEKTAKLGRISKKWDFDPPAAGVIKWKEQKKKHHRKRKQPEE